MKLVVRFIFLSTIFIWSCIGKTSKSIGSNDPIKESKEILKPNFQVLLDSSKLEGAILIFDPQKNELYSNDFDWAKTGRLPASTFKIPNSIIALETGVVENDSTNLKWDGKKRAMKIWEQDMTLKQAFHLSCVPCYQEIARKVGVSRMKAFLSKFEYGNMLVDTTNIDTFWLEGDSEITQFQQIEFLYRFYNNKIPISNETKKIMKRLMVIDENNIFKLSGKTGWAVRDGHNNGWFVGYLESNNKVYFFATNVNPKEDFDMKKFYQKRKEITLQAFETLEILPKTVLETYDNEKASEVVKSIANTFESNYVFPEKGTKIKSRLLDKLSKGEYFNLANYDTLSSVLKRDMIKITNDKHINVSYAGNKPKKEGQTSMSEFFNQFENFGFTKVDTLEGNIGYLEISIFYPLRMDEKAGEAAQKAMQSFKDCKTIIFDLRKSRGGDPGMLNLVITYLYPEGSKIHLNSFYDRPSDASSDTYTLDKVDGRRYVDEKIYVLTSNKTFSCAEEFAYDLQNLKRATLIGETTGGGAHPVRGMSICSDFEVSIPTGRAINPITKTNWEGIGVIPDVKVKQEDALEKALEIINKN